MILETRRGKPPYVINNFPLRYALSTFSLYSSLLFYPSLAASNPALVKFNDCLVLFHLYVNPTQHHQHHRQTTNQPTSMPHATHNTTQPQGPDTTTQPQRMSLFRNRVQFQYQYQDPDPSPACPISGAVRVSSASISSCAAMASMIAWTDPMRA